MTLAGISKDPALGEDYCLLCHTNGLSGDATDVGTCVDCHTLYSDTYSPTYELKGGGQTIIVPVVNYEGTDTLNENDPILAGGNFYWVAQGDDTKGHNVLGISDPDPNHPLGSGTGCSGSCHKTLAAELSGDALQCLPGARNGCEGCHLNGGIFENNKVKHHSGQSGGHVSSSAQGWYRFLSGHYSAMDDGVEGYEDGDWQATTSGTDHNEYLGHEYWPSTGYPDYAEYGGCGISLLGHTTTAYCTGCHCEYHDDQHLGKEIPANPWKRHPSDLKIPNSREFVDAFGANGTGTGTYDPDVPVARPSVTAVTDSVTLGTDMVMCLSCHRAHGSPYPKMLRWDFSGCFKCHTKK